jgi:hypothetical protein
MVQLAQKLFEKSTERVLHDGLTLTINQLIPMVNNHICDL